MTNKLAHRNTLFAFAVSCSALLATCLWASAAEPEWKVGLASVKITPERPVPMSGYAGRDKPFEKVAADLYVKAMVLEDDKGQRGGPRDQRSARLAARCR